MTDKTEKTSAESYRYTNRCLTCVFLNNTVNTEIYTLSLHDALPILNIWYVVLSCAAGAAVGSIAAYWIDRKSTRLNSSHSQSSYAVLCLKKKIRSGRKERRIERRPPNVSQQTKPEMLALDN